MRSTGTMVLLEIKQLLLLLQEGKNRNFAALSRGTAKGKSLDIEGQGKARGRVLMVSSTQVWTLDFLR